VLNGFCAFRYQLTPRMIWVSTQLYEKYQAKAELVVDV